jgi:hypothetical protein
MAIAFEVLKLTKGHDARRLPDGKSCHERSGRVTPARLGTLFDLGTPAHVQTTESTPLKVRSPLMGLIRKTPDKPIFVLVLFFVIVRQIDGVGIEHAISRLLNLGIVDVNALRVRIPLRWIIHCRVRPRRFFPGS